MKGYSLFVFALGGLLASCGGDRAKISGRLACSDPDTVYLESVSPTGNSIIDSAKTTKKGDFKFKVDLPQGPAIYNIRCDGESIPLLLAAGEHVKVNSVGKLSRNYTVEGSEGSALMKELSRIMVEGVSALDSITGRYTQLEPGQDSLRRKIASDYARQFYKTKREQIAFIVGNSGSLAAFYALYQRLPNDNVLFNGEGDVVYYRLVADSIETRLPDSPYLVPLRRQIQDMSAGNAFQQLLAQSDKIGVLNYPDLELPDMYGKKIRLSSLNGKVVLLDFWSAASDRSKMMNAEMKEFYDELSDRGFEVYQVSLDSSKPLWVTTVQNQKLPWVSVCDFRGAESPAARIYNIRSVPTNFLIDRGGNIVARDVYGAVLLEKVRALL